MNIQDKQVTYIELSQYWKNEVGYEEQVEAKFPVCTVDNECWLSYQ